MAHNIDMTHGRANMAFMGARSDVWHRLGQEMKPGMSVQEWAKAAGLEWSAIMVPAIADLSGPEFAHLGNDRMRVIDGQRHIVRSDNGNPLGYASDGYHPCQPSEVLSWFQEYISVDDRFALDVAGSLKGGKIIWATATFNGEMNVAGDKHRARLLMTTTFDQTGATINKGSMTRVVCNNTLDAALGDKKCEVRTRHNTKFNKDRVARELSAIAQTFDEYKAIGDAMAQVQFGDSEVSKLFKLCLDIPFDAKEADVSTRKLNQFRDLNNAYKSTVAEGTERGTAWTALNAVTRYVDHDRSTKTSQYGETESRFLAAQFGTGAAMKETAVEYLMANDDFKAILAQPFQPRANADISNILAQPFRPRTS